MQYEEEVKSLIRQVAGITEVVVFDHTIRKHDEEIRPPARHVHGDYNDTSARKRLDDILSTDKANEWKQGRYCIINVWRPIDYPVEVAPLAFAAPESVAADDWLDIDIIYPDRKGQIRGLIYNPNHQWLYQSNMTPDDAVVFTVYDSDGRPAIAHSAVDLIAQPENARPRHSIETRSLARFQ